MPTHAGSWPTATSSLDFRAVQDRTKSSNKPKSSIVEGNMEWDLSTGWHATRQRGWKSKVTKSNRSMVTVTSGIDGKEYKMYKYDGFDDAISFHAHQDVEAAYDERLAYAEAAFDTSRPEHGQIISQDGCGHITHLDYAVKEQVLKATFANGDVCLFFRVPTAVAGELLHHAEYKHVRQDGRHLLGIRFWDLVRIRHQRHGARYPFEYERHVDGRFAKHSNRHYIDVTTKNKDAVLGVIAGSKKYSELVRNIKAGDTISVVLNDEEYTKLADSLGAYSAEMGNENAVHKAAFGRGGEGSIGGLSSNLMAASTEDMDAGTSTKSSWTPKRELIAELQDEVRKQIAAVREDPLVAMASGLVEGTSHAIHKAEWDAFKDFAPAALLEVTRFNKGEMSVITPTNEREFLALGRAARGPGFISSWKKENTPAAYAGNFTGRVWKTSELDAFTDSITDVAVKARYKRFIDNKDYDGALNVLKSNGTEYTYTDKHGVKHSAGRFKYASPNDEVEY